LEYPVIFSIRQAFYQQYSIIHNNYPLTEVHKKARNSSVLDEAIPDPLTAVFTVTLKNNHGKEKIVMIALRKSSRTNPLLPFILLTSLIPVYGFTEISIAIQPFGNVDTTQLLPILEAVAKEFHAAEIVIRNPVALPQSAYYKPRNRYRAENLLDYLDSINDRKYYRVVGFTSKDISTTKGAIEDWGIFGLANIEGYACVLSTYRLKRDGRTDRFQSRLKRIIIHELGHTFGLYHCSWRFCVMADYKGTIKILDEQWAHLCAPCKRSFRKRYKFTY
jgi:archaemetzincin